MLVWLPTYVHVYSPDIKVRLSRSQKPRIELYQIFPIHFNLLPTVTFKTIALQATTNKHNAALLRPSSPAPSRSCERPDSLQRIRPRQLPRIRGELRPQPRNGEGKLSR